MEMKVKKHKIKVQRIPGEYGWEVRDKVSKFLYGIVWYGKDIKRWLYSEDPKAKAMFEANGSQEKKEDAVHSLVSLALANMEARRKRDEEERPFELKIEVRKLQGFYNPSVYEAAIRLDSYEKSLKVQGYSITGALRGLCDFMEQRLHTRLRDEIHTFYQEEFGNGTRDPSSS